MTDLARHHQIHGVQPVLPVPDVAAAADWFCRTLGFTVDFLHGEPPVHGRVRAGDRSWGDPVFIHLSLEAGPIAPCGETRLHVGHDVPALCEASEPLGQRGEIGPGPPGPRPRTGR